MRYFIMTSLVLLTCVCVRTFGAESTTGTITGIILDPQGNPAPDCLVVAQQAAEKMRDPLQATTDDKGSFKLENVPEGEYNLKIRTRDAKGKATKTVTVVAGKTADVGKLKLKTK